MSSQTETEQLEGIAVIGMAGRFPGAPNLNSFWKNLCAGVESLTIFGDEQLLSAGVDPSLVRSSNYVKCNFLLDGIELFDAGFFGFNPREAELTDPQHRIFLECSWEALEEAGYGPDQTPLRTGVFAGVGSNSYFRNNVFSNADLLKPLNNLQKWIAMDTDYVSTRVSYKMDLKGPSFTIQTACSTSLVAVHVACQSLLNFECDMALVGGVSIQVPQIAGYTYQEGSNLSPDGHCRAFDSDARGMVEGNGACVVVLKRVADAMADGDNIRAVIRGTAINNDGALKVGYTAPSPDGQARVIAEAQALAGFSADEISYIETHGTGTSLGDPIEIAGLTKAFRGTTQRNGFCAIGALKPSIGHLGAAAGVTGLVKTVLALQNRLLPPTVNFKHPNPGIDFENSPFYVQQTLSEWKPANGRRIAGVSAFGIGGTNAHAIVEEAPPLSPSDPPRPWQLLTISTKTREAVENATNRLAECLTNNPNLNPADVAFTLQLGRKAFSNRRIVIAKDSIDAISLLKSKNPKFVQDGKPFNGEATVAFMFPAQGAQHVNMGHDLYETEPIFREHIDHCAEFLKPRLGLDLRTVLFPEGGNAEAASEQLRQTRLTQPAVFTVDYALARLWISWGIVPDAMIGHSLGEYVAATLSGVFGIEDALTLIAERGRLMQELPSGSMLAVHLSEAELQPWLPNGISIAAINAPGLSVISGPIEAVGRLADAFRAERIEAQLLQTSHAFHSSMMEPIIEPFEKQVLQVPRNSPQIPFVSTLTGTWITADQAIDPGYWGQQTRHGVRFSPAVTELLKMPGRALLEIGPGNVLSTLARLHAKGSSSCTIVNSLRRVDENRSDRECMLTALGRLWMTGIVVDWKGVYAHERRRRVSLPTYPFERKRFWIDARQISSSRPEGANTDEECPSHISRDSESGAGSRKEKSGEVTPITEALYSRPAVKTDFIAPQTEKERALAKIWQHVLGVKEVGIHDDFFELGGESLLAVTVVSEVERIFGKRIPLASFITAPTIHMFAQLVGENQSKPSWSSLVTLNATGSKRPLFLMHSHGGNVLEYHPLAHRLGDERPVYALQARGLDGTFVEAPRIEEMASYYLKEIRSVQPHGPYYLGGFCFGGFLCLEAAQQLRTQNESVALLIMLNSWTRDYPTYAHGTTRTHQAIYGLAYRLALEWNNLSGKPFRMMLTHMAGRGRRVKDVLRTRAGIFLEKLLHGHFRNHSVAYGLERLAASHSRAWAAYSPKPYNGKVLLLSAERQPFAILPDPKMGWNELLTGEFQVRKAPGFRQNMLDEPNVEIIASTVLDALHACD